jgi:hypothetical protein
LTGIVLVVASSLADIALLAFAVSLVAFLIQTLRHKPTTRWAMATGAFLILTLLSGTISNAVSRQSGQRDTRPLKFHREFIGLCENVLKWAHLCAP